MAQLRPRRARLGKPSSMGHHLGFSFLVWRTPDVNNLFFILLPQHRRIPPRSSSSNASPGSLPIRFYDAGCAHRTNNGKPIPASRLADTSLPSPDSSRHAPKGVYSTGCIHQAATRRDPGHPGSLGVQGRPMKSEIQTVGVRYGAWIFSAACATNDTHPDARYQASPSTSTGETQK